MRNNKVPLSLVSRRTTFSEHGAGNNSESSGESPQGRIRRKCIIPSSSPRGTQSPHSTVGARRRLCDCQSRCCVSSTCDGKMIHRETARLHLGDCVYWGMHSHCQHSQTGDKIIPSISALFKKVGGLNECLANTEALSRPAANIQLEHAQSRRKKDRRAAMTPSGSSCAADSREVLRLVLNEQMQINNFPACVFIRRAPPLPLTGAKEQAAAHTENKYRPLAHLRRSQSSGDGRGRLWYARSRSVAEDTSPMTTSDYLSGTPVVRRRTPPTASGRVAESWLSFDGHGGTSDFTGPRRRPGGNGGN
ncbi:unnamed protein product [Pleuronectes platessa]|uniref:Uncharacterized protein n=1 Tax=Pleuronectes platessa TaxID=8262 RepID=A0A9N7YM32_PLEPL|nr:unnamed protein product [Pleuronectes platessa]